jgi:hypothetical protein
MQCNAIRVAAILAGVLALFGLIISCGTAPKDGNQNQGIAGDSANASAIIKDSACDETNTNTKIELAQNRINAALAADDELGEGRVKVLVRKSAAGNYLEALVEGSAGGEDEVDDLTRILRKFMRKNCVLRVTFVPTGTVPPAAANGSGGSSGLRGEDFEWSGCEHPKVVCPNGECCDPTITSNTNSPANNSNGNSNANGNANRP